ncbi:MAG: RNA polymerase sigma factor, partial [Anaerolineales bacterium]
YRIATHVCYDRFRQASYRNIPQPFDTAPDDGGNEAQWSDPDAPRLEQVIEQTEMTACVQEYIAELPDNYRTAIILHDIHRLTNPEIARMLNISLGAAKIRLHRARQRLKTALDAGCNFSRDERDVFVCEPKLPDP